MTIKIVFTGGGTAGHVTPNVALIEELQCEGWQIDYIGSTTGIEHQLIKSAHIPFHGISTGKLRRYFSWQNFIDPFKIFFGVFQAFCILRRLETEVVFSKGGFVAFPVVFAAWLRGIPVVAHESDLSPGLANRLSYPFVNKICVNFAPAKARFKRQNKVEVTGTPLRRELFDGSKQRGLESCHFNNEKPCLMVIGGSQGAEKVNRLIRSALPVLTLKYQIIHICGKGKVDASLLNTPNYCQFDYVQEELADLYAASDFIISRAGANTLSEILALQKPHLLIPLPARSSRGDQLHNAHYFGSLGVSAVIPEENCDIPNLEKALDMLIESHAEIVKKIKTLHIESASLKIISIIKEQLHAKPREAV